MREAPSKTGAAPKMMVEPLPGDQASTGQFSEFSIESHQFVARAGAFRQDHAVGEVCIRRQIILERRLENFPTLQMEGGMVGDCTKGVLQARFAQAIRADEHPDRFYLHHLGNKNFAGLAYGLACGPALIGCRRIVDQHAYQYIRINREQGGLDQRRWRLPSAPVSPPCAS